MRLWQGSPGTASDHVCLALMSLLNIWGHITTVPTSSSGTLTNVLKHRHRTWHPIPSQYTDTGPTCHCAMHWCGTSHWNTQLPILMCLVRPDHEILPRPFTHIANAELYDAVIVVVSQKFGRQCTVPTGSSTRDLWCASPLPYQLAHSCFYCGFKMWLFK